MNSLGAHVPVTPGTTTTAATQSTSSVQAAVTRTTLPTPEAPATGLPPLPLTHCAPAVNRFGAVPRAVVELVATFVDYPSQVALAATSTATQLTMRRFNPYMQVHTLFGAAMQQIGSLHREHQSGHRELQDLQRYMNEDTDGSLDPGEEGWQELYAQERDISGRIDLVSVRHASAVKSLGDQLTTHVNGYILTRASPGARDYVIACERFVAATDPASAKAIFEAEMVGLMSKKTQPNLRHMSQELKTHHAAGEFDKMQERVKIDCAILKAGIAREMCKDWTIQLVEIFRTRGPQAPADATEFASRNPDARN